MIASYLLSIPRLDSFLSIFRTKRLFGLNWVAKIKLQTLRVLRVSGFFILLKGGLVTVVFFWHTIDEADVVHVNITGMELAAYKPYARV